MKRRKANPSRRRCRSMPQGRFADRRRRSPSTVRRTTPRLSVQIPNHRLPPLAPTSCEIFDPNERPSARRPCSFIWAWELVKQHRFVSGGDKTMSFQFFFFKYITKRRFLGISGPKRRRFEAAVTNPNDVVLGM